MKSFKGIIKSTALFKAFIKYKTKKKHRKMNKEVNKNGIKAIGLISRKLESIGLSSTPFFGTLLGLIRNGRIIKHDDDIDLAVMIKDDKDWDSVCLAFRDLGYNLTYSYSLNAKTTEMTFFKKHLRIDVFGCDVSKDTVLLYTYISKPDFSYPNKYFNHCMEHKYHIAWAIKEVFLGGERINMLDLDESKILLKQMYGDNWMVPDPSWKEQETQYETELQGVFGLLKIY